MSRYYIVKLKTNSNNIKLMKFKLNDCVASKDFILNFKNNKCKISNSTKNISLNCEKDTILKVKDTLNYHIKEFNSLQKKNNSSLRFQEFEFSSSRVEDKQLLNINHAKFESWCGNNVNVFKGTNKVNEADIHLHRINNNIHMLEQRLEHWYGNDENPYVYSRLSYTTSNKRIPMNPKWYDSFSMQIKFGDLRMNYATKGKNLQHLFFDDDMVHINGGGLPTPQSSFNDGIHAYFGGNLNEKLSDNLIKRTHEDGLNQLDNWCKKNKLEEKFRIKNEPKQCRGYIILGSFYPEGELNMDSTVGEVINYYSDCVDVVSYEII